MHNIEHSSPPVRPCGYTNSVKRINPLPLILLAAACFATGGCSGGSTPDPRDWPPGSPRHPERLVLSSPGETDPLQWWKLNIESLVPEGIYPDSGTAHAAGDFIAATNAKRTAAGLEPLQMVSSLNRVAQAHAMDQATRDYWNHRTPEDLGSRDRIRAALGLEVTAGGENSSVARPGQTTVEQVVEHFSIHAGHRELLFSPDVRYIGVGIYNYSDSEHVHYVQLLVDY